MKFVLIFGPHAVGKMTVGHELEKITDLRLFHNHMTIDVVSPFFSYGTITGKKLVKLFRMELFKEIAKSDLDGIIFTFIWAFDRKVDWDYIEEICEIFRSKGAEICFVELEADFDERLRRNRSPHRLNHKPSKRNLEESENELKESVEIYRLNSHAGEVKEKNYIKINNTNLSPEETARLVKEKFKL